MSTGTPALQYWGLGSGVQSGQMIDAIIAVDEQKITQLQTKQSDLETKKSRLNDLNSSISAIASKLSIFSDTNLQSKNITNSDSNSVSISATGIAQNMNYSISVSQLAKTHIMQANKVASITSPLNYSGKMKINGLDVNIESGDSLNDVMNKINNLKDSSGNPGKVRSYIIAGTLVLESKDTGVGNNIDLTGSDAGIVGSAGLNLVTTQEAQNAKFKVNGIDAERTSNSVTDVVSGLTINLLKETTTNVNIKIQDNTDDIKSKIKDFVNSVNSAFTKIKVMTDYNSSTKTAALFTGDSTIENMRSNIVGAMQSKVDSDKGINYLFQMGISVDRYGSFNVDDTKLDKALSENLDGVMTFFNKAFIPKTAMPVTQAAPNTYNLSSKSIAYGSDKIYADGAPLTRVTTITGPLQYTIDYAKSQIITSSDVTGTITADYNDKQAAGVGLAANLNKVLNGITSSTNGIIQAKTDSLTTQSKDIDNQIDKQQKYIDNKKKMLTAQYASMEKLLTSLKSQQSYLTNATKSSDSNS